LGRLVSVYTEDNDNPLNEVVYEYNGWGQVTKSYQHEGRKDAETFFVEYIYSDDARSLLVGVRYPGDGSQTLSYYYTTGTAEYQKAGLYLGRVQKIAFPGSGGTIVSYRYSGAWRPVERKLEIAGVSIRFDEDVVPDDEGRSAFLKVTYDAWNRPTRIEDNGGNVILGIEYDGLGRAIKRGVGSAESDFYYDTGWRVLDLEVAFQFDPPDDKGAEYLSDCACCEFRFCVRAEAVAARTVDVFGNSRG